MSDLQPLVDRLFEETRVMCSKLTARSNIEEVKEYETKLLDLCEIWMLHHEKTVELLNKAIWKCEANKRLLIINQNR